MVYKFYCYAKLGIHIPQHDQWLMHNILYITRLGLSCSLIFNVKVVSVMLYTGNPKSYSSPQVQLARLFILEIISVSYLKIWCRMVCCLLYFSEPIIIQYLLGYG